jgi:hypothetical protein
VLNGTFDAAITSWTAFGTETSIWDAAGFAGGGMKVVAGAAYAGRYQNVTVTASTTYNLRFRYKNTAGDITAYGVYDVTHGAYIVVVTDLANTTTWSALQAIDVVVPAGCTSISIRLLGKANGDIVWFDDVSLYVKAAAPKLYGSWTSPVYDLTAKKKVKVWGDFETSVDDSALTWNGLWPVPNIWSSMDMTKIWSSICALDSPVQVLATINWGDTSACADGSAAYFQMCSVEFDAQYIQVVVTLIDPVADTYVYLSELNCESATRILS